MIFKIALLLSCVVTYTNCQFYGNQFDVPTPTTQEQIEASSVNSFKSRQLPGNYNLAQRSLQRPLSDVANNPPFTYERQPQQPQSTFDSYSHLINNLNRPLLRPSANPRPQYSSQSTRIPNNQQTTISQSYPQSTLQSSQQTPVRVRPTQSTPTQPDTSYVPIAQFAWKLLRSANIEGQNFVSCPLSPQLLLSYLAFSSDGDTQQELINAIGFRSPTPISRLIQSMLRSGENRELQIATSFFINDRTRLNQNFKQTAADTDVEIIPTDFLNPDGFSQQYNQWVRSKTKGTVRPARVAFPSNTKMVMSSAVYFKGEWIFKFNPAQPGAFYYAPGSAMPANMMNLKRKLQYGTIGNMAEWVNLPYNSSDTMIVVLPALGVSVDDVILNMRITDLIDSVNQDTYANVNLTLPKFKVESRTSLVEPLQKMGIRKIFTPNSEINRLAEGDQMQVSNALQQASLEVNEEGSIASSLTSFSVVALSFSPPTPDVEFNVNRPFIAIIADKRNNYPYFVAKITAPQ